MNRLFFTLLLCMLSNFCQAEDLLKEWTWNSKSLEEIKDIGFYSEKDKNLFSRKQSQTTRTPDGEPTLELKTETQEDQVAHAKTVFFLHQGLAIKAGDKFKVEFWCKGNLPGRISFNAIQNSSPWTVLGEDANKSLDIDGTWQKASLQFTASKDWNCDIWMPMIMFGSYPPGAELNIGTVRVFRTEKILPIALNTQWTVFFESESDINTVKEIPQKLPKRGGGDSVPESFQLENNELNLAKLRGTTYMANRSSAILFNEFESNSDGVMQVGMAADWWFECFVNGRHIYDTLSSGNSIKPFSPENHIFNFPVKKGRNLLAVKVKAGSEGWLFLCGAVPFRNNPNDIVRIVDGDKWKAVNMEDHPWFNGKTGRPTPVRFEKFLVKPGTALDLSGLLDPAPAGSYGRVIVNPQGKLAFEEKPETPIRFRAFNFLPVALWNFFYAYTKEEAEEFAEAIRLRGYNMVRLHMVDSFLCGKAGYPKHGKDRTMLTELDIPQSPEKLPIDKEQLDRLDHFIHCLKKRGIYIYLDAMTDSVGWTSAWDADKSKGAFRQRIYEEKFRNNWKAGTSFLLNHVNPYTGIRMADDPVLACLIFYNEQDIQLSFLKHFTSRWHDYLRKKYITFENVRTTWGEKLAESVKNFEDIPELSPEDITGNKDAVDFIESMMREITEWQFKAVRETGYKGLVSQWDMYMRLLDTPARALMPAISMHSYHAHPNSGPLSIKGYTQQLAYASWLKGTEMRVALSSSLAADSCYFRQAAVTRFLDRPFLMTEYAHNPMNPYAHERGLFFASYAALQGWDMLAPHMNTVSLYHVPMGDYGFESSIDPVSLASELLAAFIWFRGDVQTAKHAVEYRLTPDMLYSPNNLSAIGSDYAKVFMLTKIGNSYPVKPLSPVGNIRPDLIIEPTNFDTVNGSNPNFVASNTKSKDARILKNIVAQLREKHILHKANLTDPANGIFQSESGELTLNEKQMTLSVISPRLEGAILKDSNPCTLSNLTIKHCSLPASIAAISLDKERNLKDTKHILLVFATNASGSQAVFAKGGTVQIDAGTFPTLLKTGKISLSLENNAKEIPMIYALNMDGTREETVPCVFQDGKLSLSLDTGTLKYATPFFEIVFK